jgi:hypothetical protein
MKEEVRVAIARLDLAITAIETFGGGSGNVSVSLLKDVRDLLVRMVNDDLRSE